MAVAITVAVTIAAAMAVSLPFPLVLARAGVAAATAAAAPAATAMALVVRHVDLGGAGGGVAGRIDRLIGGGVGPPIATAGPLRPDREGEIGRPGVDPLDVG